MHIEVSGGTEWNSFTYVNICRTLDWSTGLDSKEISCLCMRLLWELLIPTSLDCCKNDFFFLVR